MAVSKTSAAAPADPAALSSEEEGVVASRPLSKRIYRWTKRLHMYAGLVTFVHLTVYGLAGLNSTVAVAPADRTPLPSDTSFLDYRPAAGASDAEVADHLHRLLDPALAATPPPWALRQDPEGHLVVNFWTVNGTTRATVLAEEGRLMVEQIRIPFRTFINAVHGYTLREEIDDWRTLLWAWYNEVGIWSLIFLAVTGVYLWLATRPRLTLAIGSSAAGLAAFVLLWIIIR